MRSLLEDDPRYLADEIHRKFLAAQAGIGLNTGLLRIQVLFFSETARIFDPELTYSSVKDFTGRFESVYGFLIIRASKDNSCRVIQMWFLHWRSSPWKALLGTRDQITSWRPAYGPYSFVGPFGFHHQWRRKLNRTTSLDLFP